MVEEKLWVYGGIGETRAPEITPGQLGRLENNRSGSTMITGGGVFARWWRRSKKEGKQ